MDNRIRQFLEAIVSLVNSYDDIPLEAKRLALESAMHSTERAANIEIQKQNLEEATRVSQEIDEESEASQDNNIHEI